MHAATSPVWAALGALSARGGIDPIHGLRWAGLLAGAAAVAVLVRAVARILAGRPGLVWAFALLVSTEPWLVRWSSSAMETALGALLVAVAFEATWRPVHEVAPRRAAFALGLLPLVRPEALLLVALFGIHVLRSPALRRRVDVYALALGPMVLWTALAVPLYGHVLPATLRAKSTPLGLDPARLFSNVRVLAQIFAVAGVVPVLLWLGGLRRPACFWRIDGTWAGPVWWQWTFALPIVYLLRDVQVVSRYLEVVFPVVLGLAAATVATTGPARRWRAAIVGQALVALVLTVAWIAPSARAFGDGLEDGLGDIARWLHDESDPDALVAIYDIGIVGYRSDRRILDLGGLVHPGINALRDRVDDSTIQSEGLFLEFGRPDFLVDRAFDPDVLDGKILRDVRLEAILSREVANLGLSRDRPVHYTLYRVVDP